MSTSRCDRCGETVTDLDAGFSPATLGMGHGGCGGTWRHHIPHVIRYTDGREVTVDSYAEAIAAIALEYPQCEIGHDGDLSDGGDRTLAWSCDADAIDDDGARAVASIRLARGEQ